MDDAMLSTSEQAMKRQLGRPGADSHAADKLCEWYEEVTGERDMH